MSTFVHVKRNRLHPYTYPKEDVVYIEFQYVSMGTAYNMSKKGRIRRMVKKQKESQTRLTIWFCAPRHRLSLPTMEFLQNFWRII